MSLQEAIDLRRNQGDVVVCGDDLSRNYSLAKEIEATALNGDRWTRHGPHESAGEDALPHFQPETRPPEGHTFYETPNRKARR